MLLRFPLSLMFLGGLKAHAAFLLPRRRVSYRMTFFNRKIWLTVLAAMALTVNGALAEAPVPAPDDKTYDFGLVPLGTETRHTFVLKNTGTKALKVTKVTTTCGCTTIASFRATIAPGEQGEILAVMKRPHTGYADVQVVAQTGPTLKDVYAFRITGVVVDKAALDPANLALIAAKDAVKLQAESKTLTLVDVRPSALFAEAHAKGAQNLTLLTLKARLDLKKRTVLLFSDGMGDLDWLQGIAQLKALGFKDVRLVAGGVRAWQGAGGSIEGRARPSSASLATVELSSFYQEQPTGNDWIVVLTDPKVAEAQLPSAFPVKTIPWGKDPMAFATALNAAVKGHSSDVRVLVANASGGGYDLMESALRATKVAVPVYYLQGGSLAYTTFSQRRTLAMVPQKISLAGNGAYTSSAHAGGQIIRGGCGGCGH